MALIAVQEAGDNGFGSGQAGRGLVVAKTVAGTVFVLMMSIVYGAVKIQRRRWVDDGEVDPMDQVLLPMNLLAASLIGLSLFLGLMIDRLHHYIRELRIRRKTLEAVKKQSWVFEDGKPPVYEEIKGLEAATSSLHKMIQQLETHLEEKSKEASSAEASALALRKQSEGFLLEYDRLLEENQNLGSQLQSLDRRLSHSNSKKVM